MAQVLILYFLIIRQPFLLLEYGDMFKSFFSNKWQLRLATL